LQCFLLQDRILLQQRVLPRRYSVSPFKFHYQLFSLRSSSSCWSIILHLLVSSIFSSIRCFSTQFPRKMWPIQLALRRLLVCRILFSSLILWNTP
jgi:hypothetical protein